MWRGLLFLTITPIDRGQSLYIYVLQRSPRGCKRVRTGRGSACFHYVLCIPCRCTLKLRPATYIYVAKGSSNEQLDLYLCTIAQKVSPIHSMYPPTALPHRIHLCSVASNYDNQGNLWILRAVLLCPGRLGRPSACHVTKHAPPALGHFRSWTDDEKAQETQALISHRGSSCLW